MRDPRKPRRVSITFSSDETLIDDFDRYSRQEGKDRSKILSEFIVKYIKRKKEEEQKT